MIFAWRRCWLRSYSALAASKAACASCTAPAAPFAPTSSCTCSGAVYVCSTSASNWFCRTGVPREGISDALWGVMRPATGAVTCTRPCRRGTTRPKLSITGRTVRFTACAVVNPMTSCCSGVSVSKAASWPSSCFSSRAVCLVQAETIARPSKRQTQDTAPVLIRTLLLRPDTHGPLRGSPSHLHGEEGLGVVSAYGEQAPLCVQYAQQVSRAFAVTFLGQGCGLFRLDHE